jgi:hypothetical protein
MKWWRYAAVALVFAALVSSAPAQVAVGTTPASGSDQSQTIFKLLDNEYIHVDLKAISQDKGSFGVDYKVQFSKHLGQDGTRRNWDVDLKATGFLTADADKNDIDSLITQLAFQANPLWGIPPEGGATIPPELLDDPVKLKAWTDENGARFISPLSVYGQAHFKHETTQNGDVYDFAFGAALAVTTGYLNRILDTPFSLLRIPSKSHPESNNGPRQLDVSVGYDFVTGRHVDSSSGISQNEGDVNRMVYRAEWETGVLRGDRLIFSFNGHHQIAGPSSIDGFHPFFLARYEHILFQLPNAQTSFAINYTAGELPPAFKTGQIIGAGFSIEWK